MVDASGHVVERKVVLGLRTADRVEVISGIEAGDQVIVGDRSSLLPGELVSPQLVDITLKS